jgi:hypothetical protein
VSIYFGDFPNDKKTYCSSAWVAQFPERCPEVKIGAYPKKLNLGYAFYFVLATGVLN